MNEWPQWFTVPVTALPRTTAEYRLALVRRRIGEVQELLAEVERVAESSPNDNEMKSAVSKVVQIRRDVDDLEKIVGIDRHDSPQIHQRSEEKAH
jgi:hypothetical protein